MQAMDYIFYRTTKFFYKKDGASGHRALIILSAFQSLVIIEIVLIIVFNFYTRDEIYQFTSVAKFLGGAICVIVFFLNFLRYKDKYKLFRDKWRNEEIKVKRKRGILIVVVLIIPWLVLITFGIR